MLQSHNLPSGKNKKKIRIGRGNAGSGNYSGRGMKGQRSRSGGKGGLKLRGLKQSMMAVPKNRGFSSPHARTATVNVSELERLFAENDTVNLETLKKQGLIRSSSTTVKILGNGELKKKLQVTANSASAKAAEAIEKAGGTFTEMTKKPRTLLPRGERPERKK